mgnify:CR=1 FL=1
MIIKMQLTAYVNLDREEYEFCINNPDEGIQLVKKQDKLILDMEEVE